MRTLDKSRKSSNQANPDSNTFTRTPKLRFKDENGKEFPKWDWFHGNDLFDSISDKNHNSDLPILAITQDMGAVPRDMINYQMTVTDSSIASYKVVQKGDFIISLRTFQGGIEYSNYKGICSPAYNILRPSSDNVHREFYKCYLKTSRYIKQLQKNLEGIRDGKMISFKYFSEIKLPHPSKKEQQKIAAFLSAVDEKIQQLTRKKEALERYKKGVMQQLFSGKLRFKDENGKAFPKWEEKRLGDVSKIYDGTHQTPTYVKEGIPFYSVEHVTANQFSETKFISREVFEKENEKVRLEKGDILMTKIGDIGTARLIDWDVEASFYVSLALLKQSKSVMPNYLNQYIASRNFQLELWKRIIHVAFPKKINLGEIGFCKILVPVFEEQNKIACYLSGIDTKIECVSSQITEAQTFKKGLLQQLFV
jgi:restriction endonuclease S subunit